MCDEDDGADTRAVSWRSVSSVYSIEWSGLYRHLVSRVSYRCHDEINGPDLLAQSRM